MGRKEKNLLSSSNGLNNNSTVLQNRIAAHPPFPLFLNFPNERALAPFTRFAHASLFSFTPHTLDHIQMVSMRFNQCGERGIRIRVIVSVSFPLRG